MQLLVGVQSFGGYVQFKIFKEGPDRLVSSVTAKGRDIAGISFNDRETFVPAEEHNDYNE